jgi:anti-sigma factor RsiW
MKDDPVHLTGEQIQDLLDGRLVGEPGQQAQAHLDACARCRREWEALRATQQAVRRAGRAREVPPDLSARVRLALARADREERAAPRIRALPWLAAAAVLLLAALAALLLRPGIPARVAGDYAAYRAGSLPLEIRTDDPQALEAFFRDQGLTFRTRVLDLRMMQYRLVGGRVHRVGDRPSAFFVYRGNGNKIVVCQMYPGTIGKLPPGAQRREANGIVFHAVSRGRETMVFWQEGDVVCVLVSDIPSEEVVALAVAKAMKA